MTLNQKKDYKPVTQFCAVSIMDRYLAALGSNRTKVPDHALLATVSMLMAAKLE